MPCRKRNPGNRSVVVVSQTCLTFHQDLYIQNLLNCWRFVTKPDMPNTLALLKALLGMYRQSQEYVYFQLGEVNCKAVTINLCI